jgi:hypothetical protein
LTCPFEKGTGSAGDERRETICAFYRVRGRLCAAVWESREAFDAFGATLLPILTAAGIELNEPMVARVHNEIKA